MNRDNFQPSGFFLMDKGPGISSARAIAQLKHSLGIRKIGHAGTLDPPATGLLVCLVNDATRLARQIEGGDKIYSGSILFGVSTSTDDSTGEVLARSEAIPSFKEIEEAATRFVGEIEQIPPSVSAVKKDGERAYKIARRGEAVELKPRKVVIHSLKLKPLSANEVAFEIHCTKGTYIRAIARDLGKIFGCGACSSSLRRDGSAPFSVNDAKTVDQLSWGDLIEASPHDPKYREAVTCRP